MVEGEIALDLDSAVVVFFVPVDEPLLHAVVQRELHLSLKILGDRQHLCQLVLENVEVGSLQHAQLANLLNSPRIILNDEMLVIVPEVLDDICKMTEHLINHLLQLLALFMLLLVDGIQREGPKHLHVLLLLFEELASIAYQ